MMPPEPSGLYLAEGLVITSIRSMESAGNCESTSARLAAPIKALDRPSIRICTLVSPRKLTLPSMSTCTEGMFCSTSAALPVVA